MEKRGLFKAITSRLSWLPLRFSFQKEKPKSVDVGPKVSVTHFEDKFVVRMPTEELERGHFHWNYKDGFLVIRGARQGKTNNSLDRAKGSFIHKIGLPENLDFSNRISLLGSDSFELTIPINKNWIDDRIKTICYKRAA